MKKYIERTSKRTCGGARCVSARYVLKGLLGGAALAIGMSASASAAQDCVGQWQEFGGGASSSVNAFIMFDDGTGNALYAAGEFSSIGGASASRIARWDGAGWSSLGAGLNQTVNALAVFDSGRGPELYAAGSFSMAGGIPVSNIAKWDGVSWSGVGGGVNDWVNALAVYDDGDGGSLYATGEFTSAGGVSASRIAKWTGLQWRQLGSSGLRSIDEDFLPAEGRAMAVYDDGAGPELYIGGLFAGAGFIESDNIIKWNGAFDSMPFIGDKINSMAVHDDGTGPSLYLGGEFTFPGKRILKWDGTQYSTLGAGLSEGSASVSVMTSIDLGSERRLLVGGQFDMAGVIAAKNIAQWDGQSWSHLGDGLDGFTDYFGTVRAIIPIYNGANAMALAGGRITGSGNHDLARIASWIFCDVASCPADLTSDGALNFFDISAFLVAYQNQESAADFTGDGSFNFFDIADFLTAFSAGCP